VTSLGKLIGIEDYTHSKYSIEFHLKAAAIDSNLHQSHVSWNI